MQMYFIAIVLPHQLNEKILKYKNYMLEQYQCRVALKSPAHITLVSPFWMEEQKEEQLISDIDRLSAEARFFPMTTNNFSAFKPRTIFVAINPSQELENLKRRADEIFGNNLNYKIKTETRDFHPHITIATRDLHKGAFHECWPIFEKKEFKEEWTAENISLLRHNKKNWDVVYTSQFKNL